MPESVSWLAIFDWHHAGFLLLFGLLSLFINLVATKRSQLDAWVEARPRVAGVFKLLRGFGLDPWLIAQGVCLLFKSRLPEYVTQDADELKRKLRLERSKPPFLPLVVIGMLLGLLVLVFGCQRETRPPCDYAQYGAVIAKCTLLSDECRRNGLTEETCPSVKPCKDEIRKVCSQ